MHSVLKSHAARLSSAGAVLVLAGGCVDLVGADFAKYVENDEKTFTVSGRPDVSLATFDGAIEVRPWDRPEVHVVIEKRAVDKAGAETIQVDAQQAGNQIAVDVKVPRREHGIDFRFGDHRSAKLIVSVPAASNVTAKSGDGSIDVEGLEGRSELRSGDGAIRGRQLSGDVRAHTGDGSIRLDGIRGTLDVDTGDGSIAASGTFTSVRARTGDGSMTIAAEPGSSATADWNITTGDGSVTLALPDGFGGEIDAHTGDGRIHMRDMTLSNVMGEIRRNTVRGRLGAGGSTVRVRTGDGSITLKRSVLAERPTSPDALR
jgi:DUF4097 and DUF4098 domain-containing protein YvlB